MQRHRMHRLPALIRKPVYVITGILLFLVIVPLMFRLGMITGVGFALSFLLAVYRGILWRDAHVVLFIALGYAITAFAFKLLVPLAYVSWESESMITAVLVCGVFSMIWWRARRLKQGRR